MCWTLEAVASVLWRLLPVCWTLRWTSFPSCARDCMMGWSHPQDTARANTSEVSVGHVGSSCDIRIIDEWTQVRFECSTLSLLRTGSACFVLFSAMRLDHTCASILELAPLSSESFNARLVVLGATSNNCRTKQRNMFVEMS